ncbi:MAG TPA: hypothetical protein VL974_11990 [Magnetospirillum sp.]|nr:hypothetical protein [Magnetospirillum sp.]
MTTHAQPAQGASIVTRPLALAEPGDGAAIARLGQAEGVLGVSASPDRKRLLVTYDVRHMVMAALEKVAAQAGLMPSIGLFARLARAWAGFQDDNLRAQAKVEHHCCSAPPK